MTAAPWESWLWKNLVCRWFHRKHWCYPGVYLPRPTYWHCSKCSPCGKEFDHMLERAAGTDQSQVKSDPHVCEYCPRWSVENCAACSRGQGEVNFVF